MRRLTLGGVLTCGLLLALGTAGVEASGHPKPQGWAEPRRLSRDGWHATTPFVLADASGAPHAFWTCEAPEDSGYVGVCYTHETEGSWAEPNDVLDVPGGVPSDPVAVLQGPILHLIGRGGWYTSASVGSAATAHGWSPPTSWVPGTLDGDLAVDSSGALHMVYSVLNGDVVHLASTDGGESWSLPVRVSVVERGRATNWPRIAIGDSDAIHVVWTEFAEAKGWVYDGVYYARSADGGRTWTPLLEIARGNYGAISVVARESEIHLAWNVGSAGKGRYHQWSLDEGQSWTRPQEVVPGLGGGMSGFPDMAFDSAGTLHMVTSTSYNGRSGIFHLAWQGEGWTEPEPVSGDVTGHAIEEPRIAVGGGNRLHVVFRDGSGGVWYTTKTTEAPDLAAKVSPTAAMQAGATGTPDTTATQQPTAAPASQLTASDLVTQDVVLARPGSAIYVAGVSSALLLITVILLRLRTRET